MTWQREKELTPAQVKAAATAGVWIDRPGLGAEYPKAVYKIGESDDHRHVGQPILVQGKYPVDTGTVNNETEEADAMAQGWHLTPQDACGGADYEPPVQKRGPGRPPKAIEGTALKPLN